MGIDNILQEQADIEGIQRERQRKTERRQLANAQTSQTAQTRSRTSGITADGLHIDRGDLQVILRVVEIALLILILRKL